MDNDDNYFNELSNNSFEEYEKPFNQVFKVVQTELGQQIIPLMKTKILDTALNPGQTFFDKAILLNDKPIYDFFDKILVGKLHSDSKVFHITGHLDIPSGD